MPNFLLRYCFQSVVTFIILTQAFLLNAQTENPLLFNNLKVKDGLPVNEIFTVNQDKSGFIWMGTVNGFVRYDGYEMKTFRNDGNNSIALPDNQITSIENDNSGGLWIGCYQGLIFFDPETWKSKLIDLGGIREVRCLLSQGDSLLWVGTSEGLFRLNTKTLSFKIFNEQNSSLGSNIVRALFTDSNGVVWVGTFDGLNSILKDGTVEYYNLKGNYKPELKNNLILDIQPFANNSDNDNQLWIGTETGLVLFDRQTHISKVFNAQNSGFDNEVVKCIHPLKNGKVYFGTDFGFYFFDSNSLNFQISTHNPFNNYSLANNVVWDIFEDNAGILWLATSNGISQLKTNQNNFSFTPIYNRVGETIVGNQVNSLYCDNDKTIWLATKKGVISISSDGKRELFTANNPPATRLVFDNINTITGDNLGRIWIGSAGGINVWDKKQRRMYSITANFDLNKGLRSNYISAFVTPPDGSFWVLTWGGGMYKAKGNFNMVDEINFEYITNFNTNIFSFNKKIWIKQDKKVFTIDLTSLKIETPDELNATIGNREIYSMLITSSGFLWMGLNDQLLKFNTTTGENIFYDLHIGKESYLNNLVEDFNGDLWGTTLTAIVKFSVANNQIETFPVNKGLPLDIFLTKSCTRSNTGLLFFGGNDGFITFNPKDIKKDLFCPPTVISGFKVGSDVVYSANELKGNNRSDKLITYSDKISLKYNQRSFSIAFSSLHFGDPDRNLFAYMLEGYDNDWNYTSGNQNSVTYSNLSPDKYSFKVKGTNGDGVWTNVPASLSIVVKPPVWASAWAIVIYIIILQMVLILLVQTYRNKIRWKERIRTITVEKEKNEEISQAKQQFFTNISHEFRTPLNLILGPVQHLLEKHKADDDSRTLMQMILKNSRRLLSLVNQLMDIRKIEDKTLKLNLQPVEIINFCKEQFDLFTDLAMNKNINFRFVAPNIEQNLITDPVKLESIIQNLLSNAFKFTPPNGSIELILEFSNENMLYLTVSDSGIGIPEEDQLHIFERFYQGKTSQNRQIGHGIGLNIAKEYTELMEGNISMTSQINKGTRFKVTIPLKDNFNIANSDSLVKIKTVDLSSKSKRTDHIINDQSLSSILIVDDHPDILEFIRISLANKYHFIMASSGSEALKILEKHKIDLIISDVMMPDIDGLSLCGQVKANPRLSNIPFILLTAMTRAANHIEGYKAGADDYLVKPFNTEVLEARIESLLNRGRKIEEYIKQKLIVENHEVEVDSLNEKLLQETIQYINQHINDPEINIDRMCKAIGVSHSNLYRKIKILTGLTLNELIRQVKLKKAAQLIKTKKLTIAEIMDETGFTNHSYFAKCFKNEYGMSPREYGEK